MVMSQTVFLLCLFVALPAEAAGSPCTTASCRSNTPNANDTEEVDLLQQRVKIASSIENDHSDNGQDMAPPPTTPIPTCLQELYVREFMADNENENFRKCLNLSPSAQLVRHVFHDALDFNNIEARVPSSADVEALPWLAGGIDGCLMSGRAHGSWDKADLGHNDGMGSAQAIVQRTDYYPLPILRTTLADRSVVGATVGIEEILGGPHLPLLWGREDMPIEQCRKMAGYKHDGHIWKPTGAATHFIKNMPSGKSFEPQPLLSVFQQRGFTKKDAVALFGAHTVGMIDFCAADWRFPHQGSYCAVNRQYHIRADDAKKTRHFDQGAAWDQTPDCFDNRYFQSFSNAPYESLDRCCGKCIRASTLKVWALATGRKSGSFTNWCKPHDRWGHPWGDGGDHVGTGGPQCNLELLWCRSESITPGTHDEFWRRGRDYPGYLPLMKNMRDYAFTNSKMTDQFGSETNQNPNGAGDCSVKKIPLVRTAADWALLGDAEAKSHVEEFASSEQAFFDAFQAAWEKLQRMTRSAPELQTCKQVPCTAYWNGFECGASWRRGKLFQYDNYACKAPESTGPCSLVGAIGARAVISCRGIERLCCRGKPCSGILRAWQHRQDQPLASCPVPAITGDSAIQNNELQKNLTFAHDAGINLCKLPRSSSLLGMRND